MGAHRYYNCKAMSKITSKYQVSIPKALAERLGLSPGDEIEWSDAGDELRIRRSREALSVEERLKMWEARIKRQHDRERGIKPPAEKATSRGWTREELYGDRGRPRR
jgi:AbrB family looped-hinge helix DNA binding protein